MCYVVWLAYFLYKESFSDRDVMKFWLEMNELIFIGHHGLV